MLCWGSKEISFQCKSDNTRKSHVPKANIPVDSETHRVHKLCGIRHKGEQRDPQELFVDPTAVEDDVDDVDENLRNHRIEERAREQHTRAERPAPAWRVVPTMSPTCTIVVLSPDTGCTQTGRRALVSKRRDGRDGHRTCKIVRGDCRRKSRLDDFGNMLDLLNEGRDPGLLQVRNVLAHGRRGWRGERDMYGRVLSLLLAY